VGLPHVRVGHCQVPLKETRLTAGFLLSEPQKNDFFYIDNRAIDVTSNARFRYVPLKVLAVVNETLTFKV
jgi:hypothetical protein